MRILLFDSLLSGASLANALTMRGHVVVIAQKAEKAELHLRNERFDLAVLTYSEGEMDGVKLLHKIKRTRELGDLRELSVCVISWGELYFEEGKPEGRLAAICTTAGVDFIRRSSTSLKGVADELSQMARRSLLSRI